MLTGRNAFPIERRPVGIQSLQKFLAQKATQVGNHLQSQYAYEEPDSFLPQLDPLVLIEQAQQNAVKAKRIWSWCLWSLPVDALLFSLFSSELGVEGVSDSAELLLSFSLLIGLFTLIREQALDFLLTLQGFRGKVRSAQRNFSGLISVLFALYLVFDIVIKLSDFSSIAVMTVLIIAAVGSPWWFQAFVRNRKEQEPITPTPQEAIWQAWGLNQQISFCIIASVLFARLPSLIATIALSIAGQPMSTFLLYLAATGALVLIAEPRMEQFVLPCKRCGQRASRAFKNTFQCPRCMDRRYSERVNLKRKQRVVTGPEKSVAELVSEYFPKPLRKGVKEFLESVL